MAKLDEAPKPGNDVYTGLLALSLVAMIIGCVLLYLDFSNYEGRTPPAIQKFEMPNAVRTSPAPAGPRGAPEGKEGARLPAPKAPDLTLPNMVAGRPPEPAKLPPMIDLPKIDTQVKQAEYTELPPLLPSAAKPSAPAAAKPAGDEPPLPVKPFTPN